MASGSNKADFAPAQFRNYLTSELSAKMSADFEVVTWQGDSATSSYPMGLCDGLLKQFGADATVVDVNGCVSNPAITTFVISEPTELIPNGSISSNYNGQDISCFGGSDGEITAVVTGGTLPYTYSINGGTFSTNNVFTGLVAGTYIIDYLDANGCDTSETFTLTNPPDLSGALTISQQVSCNGVADGEIQFIVNNISTGTPGYQFSDDGGNSFQGSNTFTGLAGGQSHSIMVQDVNGCQFTASVFLPEPSEITFSVSSTNFNGLGVRCNGDNDGQIIDAHSISAGLDYPGIGPEHSWLHDIGRIKYLSTTDEESLIAFELCSKLEGIIPALEPAHALHITGELAKKRKGEIIIMNMCGRGDKDLSSVLPLIMQKRG
jgi:hypothetical protein